MTPASTRAATSKSVHRLAAAVTALVGFVGERLDDADVEGEGGERGRAAARGAGRGRTSSAPIPLLLFASVEAGRRGSAVVVAEVAGGVVGGAEKLSLSERRIDLGGGRGPEPLAVVDLDQEEASARSCAHAPSALSHPLSVAAALCPRSSSSFAWSAPPIRAPVVSNGSTIQARDDDRNHAHLPGSCNVEGQHHRPETRWQRGDLLPLRDAERDAAAATPSTPDEGGLPARRGRPGPR